MRGVSQPFPLDDTVTHGSGDPSYELVQEILRSVQDQGSGASPTEVAEEVRLRLDRLRRAWQAAEL
jgi:hypothetical protein